MKSSGVPRKSQEGPRKSLDDPEGSRNFGVPWEPWGQIKSFFIRFVRFLESWEFVNIDFSLGSVILSGLSFALAAGGACSDTNLSSSFFFFSSIIFLAFGAYGILVLSVI